MTTLNLRLSKTFNLKRLKAKNIIPSLLFYGLLSLGAIFISVPIIWMVSASFMTTNEIFSPQIKLFPESLRLNNFVTVFTEFNFARYLLNSIIVTGSIILLNLIFCPLVGYSLAKFQYPGRNLLFTFIMATVMVPFTAILIPLYLIIRSLGWIDTYPRG